MTISNDLPKPFFVLAPMDDVTDTVFRQIIRSLYEPASQQGKAVGGPDLYVTEFVNVDGLMSPGRLKLMKKLRFAANEGPLVAQLWGLKPENFEAIARQIADGTIARELGLPDGVNYVGVDINMGCPAKSEVQNGACSALIKNRPLAKEIILATKKGAADGSRRCLQLEATQGEREKQTEPYINTVMGASEQLNVAVAQKHQQAPSSASRQADAVQVPTMPVSVKTRLGFSEIDLSWHEFLLGFDLAMLTVHWRTRKEMSKVPAHWEYADDIVKIRDRIAKNTLVVGNGDVLSRKQGEELVKKYKLDGIMIGRGIFHDPFIFYKEAPCEWEDYDKASKIELYRKHVELFEKTWQAGERPVHTLNKFCKMYVNGFDGAKEMRDKLMKAESTKELLSLL